jgi:hypothetical protein
MISDLMLAIILQKIDFSPEDLRATEHPESYRTVNERCKLDQLKGLSVEALIEKRRFTVGIGNKEPLNYIEHKKGKRGNWKEDRKTRTEHKSYKYDVN